MSLGKIIYFGAGGSGFAYCQHSGINPDFFVDNDQTKWGNYIESIEIKSPDEIKKNQIKKIVITSGYVKDILPQILALGVNIDKVEIPPKSFLGLHPFKDETTRNQAAKMLFKIMASLSSKCKVVAVGGTALGFARDSDFIHWDNDIDLFAPLKSKADVFNLLNDMGCNPYYDLDSSMPSIHSQLTLENKTIIELSVDFFDTSSDSFDDIFEDYIWKWPTSMFTDCSKIEVHGFKMNVPNPVSEYLTKVYGRSWVEPKPEFNHSDYAPNNE